MTPSTTSCDQSAFNDQSPLYSSGIIGSYISYLRSQHLDLDTDELLRCSRLSQLDINYPGHCLTQRQINHFHACLDEMLADPEVSYKVGQHTLHTKSTRTIVQAGLHLLTPGSIYKALDRIYPK